MTERIYYTDPACRAFDAVVTRAFEHDGRPAVTLTRTAFYPTSGGQPFDVGTLAGLPVREVHDQDDDVVHVVEIAPETGAGLAVGARVSGAIDWARRLDHMQQHTGQHVLSAAIERVTARQMTHARSGRRR